MPAPPRFLGIDLGGTKVLSLAVLADGEVVAEDRRPSLASVGPDAVIENLVGSARAALDAAGVSIAAVKRAGLSAPGPIDAVRGVVTTPPNFADWRDVPLGAEVSRRLGVAVSMENDGNCAALGELEFGAGRGSRHLIYIGLGTGLGGGVIIDGALFTGSTGAGGELGHIVVNADGRRCGCGSTGCIEAYCSGAAFAARARELLDQRRAPILAELATDGRPDAALVFTAANAGDQDCKGLIAEAARYLGVLFASLLNAFNPERIVVGGGLANSWESLVEPAIAEMRLRAFPATLAAARLVRGLLGSRSGALGAAALAIRDASDAEVRR